MLHADSAGAVYGPNRLRDRPVPPARVALYGDKRSSQRPPGVVPPADEGRPPRGSAGASRQAAELIAGLERRGSAVGGSSGAVGTAGEDFGELPGDGLLARRGAASPPKASGGDSSAPDGNKRHTLEFVDDPPKPQGDNDVLLSIPFKGDITPAVGSVATAADGLVHHGDDIEFTDDAQFSFPAGENINSHQGTIAFDVQPQWAGGDQSDNSLVQIREEHVWENSLSVVKNLDALRFIIIDSSGEERNVNVPIDDWQAGESRHLVATWDDTTMALYVNGNLVGQTDLPHPLTIAETTPVHIGSDFPGSSYAGAGGRISQFTVYGHALTPVEIAGR
jgi:hypothetical protein